MGIRILTDAFHDVLVVFFTEQTRHALFLFSIEVSLSITPDADIVLVEERSVRRTDTLPVFQVVHEPVGTSLALLTASVPVATSYALDAFALEVDKRRVIRTNTLFDFVIPKSALRTYLAFLHIRIPHPWQVAADTVSCTIYMGPFFGADTLLQG